MPDFTPLRLTLARKRRGMTKKALADKVGVTTRSISAYERDEKRPSGSTLERLSDVLGFPVDFFSRPETDEFPIGATSFRALSRMTQKQRDQATAAGEVAFMLSDWIDARFALPAADVPKLRGVDPDNAAAAVRVGWTLGERPLGNMVHILEAHGVRVFSLSEESRNLDAFSCWRQKPESAEVQPFIFLNTMKTSEHSRMDAAHELGHLVLHWRHESPRGREAENEASVFASALLMPAASVLAGAPRGGTLDQVIAAKRQWNVSAAALVFRMRKLHLLTQWQYESLFKQMAARGLLSCELHGIERETSQILPKVFKALRDEGTSQADVARDLGLPTEEVGKLVFGLMVTGLSGGGDKSAEALPAKRSRLRLI
jgi:Zn-dependent peptidase ImmA (M78 family)/transcriptional regulator with XRE-family HTH domain